MFGTGEKGEWSWSGESDASLSAHREMLCRIFEAGLGKWQGYGPQLRRC